jgi:hypothetical protein
MKSHTVFCSATDHEVVLVARSGDLPSALARGDIACLENGARCTGASCPFCAGRPTAGERLAADRPAPHA